MNTLLAAVLLLAGSTLAAPVSSTTTTAQNRALDLSPRPNANVTANLAASHRTVDPPYYGYQYSFKVLVQQQCEGPNLATSIWFSPVFDKHGYYIDYPFPNPINAHADKAARVNIQGYNLWASTSDNTVKFRYRGTDWNNTQEHVLGSFFDCKADKWSSKSLDCGLIKPGTRTFDTECEFFPIKYKPGSRKLAHASEPRSATSHPTQRTSNPTQSRLAGYPASPAEKETDAEAHEATQTRDF